MICLRAFKLCWVKGGRDFPAGNVSVLELRALYREPTLLVLDEATSALDKATACAIMAELLAMRGHVSMIFAIP